MCVNNIYKRLIPPKKKKHATLFLSTIEMTSIAVKYALHRYSDGTMLALCKETTVTMPMRDKAHTATHPNNALSEILCLHSVLLVPRFPCSQHDIL